MTDHLKSVRSLLSQARTHQTLHRTEQTLVGAIEGLLEWAELQAAVKLTGIFSSDVDKCRVATIARQAARISELEAQLGAAEKARDEARYDASCVHRMCEEQHDALRVIAERLGIELHDTRGYGVHEEKRDEFVDKIDSLKEQLSLARNERDELGKRMVDEAPASLPPPVAPEPADPPARSKPQRYYWDIAKGEAFPGHPVGQASGAQAQAEPEQPWNPKVNDYVRFKPGADTRRKADAGDTWRIRETITDGESVVAIKLVMRDPTYGLSLFEPAEPPGSWLADGLREISESATPEQHRRVEGHPSGFIKPAEPPAAPAPDVERLRLEEHNK